MAAPMIAAVKGSFSFSISLCLCDSVVSNRIETYSEFPAVLFGPAFDYYFLVGIELDGVAALAVEIAEETVLPSAEGEIGHGRGDSDVDADVARGRFVAEAARGGSARREQRCLIAVGAALEEGEGFVHVVGVDEAEHRAEDFRVGEIAGCGHVVENRGIHEVSRFVLGDFRVAAVEQDFRALFFTEADQRLDAGFALGRDDRAHLDAFVEAVADFEFRGSIGDRVAKSFLRFTDRDRDRDGETALSGASKGAVADDLRGHRHVGVGKNDDVVLGSALTLAALALLGGARVDVARDRSRANEADGADFGVVDERVDNRLAAVDEADTTPFGRPVLSSNS